MEKKNNIFNIICSTIFVTTQQRLMNKNKRINKSIVDLLSKTSKKRRTK